MSRPGTAWDRHEDAGWRETGDRVVDCRIMNDSMVIPGHPTRSHSTSAWEESGPSNSKRQQVTRE